MARKSRKANRAPERPEARTAPATWSVGVYARLSAENNGREDQSSIETQVDIITAAIAKMPDARIAGIWRDNGHTGTNMDRAGFQSLRVLHHCRRVNDFSREFRIRCRDSFHTSRIRICAVDNPTVRGTVLNLGSDFLYIRTIGYNSFADQIRLTDAKVFKNFGGIGTYRYVRIPHAEDQVITALRAFQFADKIIPACNLTRVIFRSYQNRGVFQKIDTGAIQDIIFPETFVTAAIQFIHLFLGSGNEYITGSTL